VLLAGAAMFGGGYLWAAIALAAAVVVLLALIRPRLGPSGPLRTLDLSLAALLAAVLVQAVPLPARVTLAVSPARDAFAAPTSLQPGSASRFLPLTLDGAATAHAWLVLFSIVATFWIARAIFARGGIRTFATILAWGAIVLAVVAFAQHAAGTPLVYGFWRPRDAGARPLGPFINRNHFGTWAIMAICVCGGFLQWRSAGVSPLMPWRARLGHWLEGRRLTVRLAVVVLASAIGLGASRSSLVALACAAGYVALAAPAAPMPGRSSAGRGFSGRTRRRLSLAVLAGVSVFGMLAYGDGDRLLLRLDETRTTGMANRLAIWRDSAAVIRDFPATGVGAGAFATAMRVYQTTPRTYYHNEAHNQYLQLLVEGGVLLLMPALIALGAFTTAAWKRLRRPDDPLRWMRVAGTGALFGVAVQSIWETGLTLPANGMLAAAVAALVVHESRPSFDS
jgi:O-antigen ligase